MKISKITQGYVLQTYDTETGKCKSQEFIAGDECEYETEYGEHFDIDDSETELEYQPYEMVQPNSDDTYDKYGVNTKNSFNTPPKQ
jgi:uncharacterized protein (DUF608 family)